MQNKLIAVSWYSKVICLTLIFKCNTIFRMPFVFRDNKLVEFTFVSLTAVLRNLLFLNYRWSFGFYTIIKLTFAFRNFVSLLSMRLFVFDDFRFDFSRLY